MANVTFVSPRMARDVTVYAVAGDRGTILALAKQHKIPIPFDCQDGECGSCLVRVQLVSSAHPYGIALTEKEKERLKELGKITREEIMNAEVNDRPPTYRLACQCFVRNEDIIVSFEGDATTPEKQPQLSIAAAVYTGGVAIETLAQFLGLAVQVEEDAAIHFEKLAKNMEACGNAEVAALFNQLAGYSRLHLAEAKARASAHDAPVALPPKSAWPDKETPERTTLWAGDPGLSRLDALKAALQGERRGYEFYYAVANTSSNAEIRKAAREFVTEEAQHVDTLKLWISKEENQLRERSPARA